jgi:hypothetical protein
MTISDNKAWVSNLHYLQLTCLLDTKEYILNKLALQPVLQTTSRVTDKRLSGIKHEGTTLITDEIERSDEFDLLKKHDAIKQENKAYSSLIPVIYLDNSPGMVKPEELDELIQNRRILSFRRSNEWVRISGDTIREHVKKFEGNNKRKS